MSKISASLGGSLTGRTARRRLRLDRWLQRAAATPARRRDGVASVAARRCLAPQVERRARRRPRGDCGAAATTCAVAVAAASAAAAARRRRAVARRARARARGAVAALKKPMGGFQAWRPSRGARACSHTLGPLEVQACQTLALQAFAAKGEPNLNRKKPSDRIPLRPQCSRHVSSGFEGLSRPAAPPRLAASATRRRRRARGGRGLGLGLGGRRERVELRPRAGPGPPAPRAPARRPRPAPGDAHEFEPRGLIHDLPDGLAIDGTERGALVRLRRAVGLGPLDAHGAAGAVDVQLDAELALEGHCDFLGHDASMGRGPPRGRQPERARPERDRIIEPKLAACKILTSVSGCLRLAVLNGLRTTSGPHPARRAPTPAPRAA